MFVVVVSVVGDFEVGKRSKVKECWRQERTLGRVKVHKAGYG